MAELRQLSNREERRLKKLDLPPREEECLRNAWARDKEDKYPLLRIRLKIITVSLANIFTELFFIFRKESR